jgi:hypothetical protein
MNGRRHGWLVRLFPRAWWERYGDEFLALLEAEGLSLAGVADIVKTAAFEWGRALIIEGRHLMSMGPKSLVAVSAKPSAILPVLMSLVALVVAIIGVTSVLSSGRRPADEGALAHIFQILVVAQVPVIGFFILRWIRSNARAVVLVLAVQGVALAAALLPVWYFKL